MDVRDIIKEAITVSETTSFREAVQEMVSKQTNTLLVINEDGKLVGEVGVADLLDGIVPEYLDGDSIAAHFATEEMFEEAVREAEDKEVQFFMSRDFSTVEIDDGLMAVAATAIANQQARIPVVDKEGKPIGIISRRGLKHIIAQFLNIPDSE